MRKTFLMFLFYALFITAFGWSAQRHGADSDFTVKAMTRNMFPGADLGIVAESQTPEELESAVLATINDVIQS